MKTVGFVRALVFVGFVIVAGCEETPRPVVLAEKSPEQLDREALNDLVAAGGDPTAVHALQHVLLFADVQKARDAAAALQLLGYRISLKRNPSAPPERQFMLLAETEAVPSLEYLKHSRDSLGGLAQRLGGVYDGFELALRPSGADGGA